MLCHGVGGFCIEWPKPKSLIQFVFLDAHWILLYLEPFPLLYDLVIIRSSWEQGPSLSSSPFYSNLLIAFAIDVENPGELAQLWAMFLTWNLQKCLIPRKLIWLCLHAKSQEEEDEIHRGKNTLRIEVWVGLAIRFPYNHITCHYVDPKN